MNEKRDPIRERDQVPLRFERTSTCLTVLAVDARGLELLRPLARSAEVAEGVREVRLYCDRVVVELGMHEGQPSTGALGRDG